MQIFWNIYHQEFIAINFNDFKDALIKSDAVGFTDAMLIVSVLEKTLKGYIYREVLRSYEQKPIGEIE